MKLNFFVLSLICCAQVSLAADQATAHFLNMDAGARASSMHGAYTAAGGDLQGVFYNPANLAALGAREISLSHTELILNAGYDVVQYGHPTRHNGWAVGFSRLSSGAIDGRDETRRPTASFEVEDIMGSLSWAHGFGSRLAFGTTVKYVGQRVGSDRGSTFAFDAGLSTQLPGKPLWLGFSILHLGPGLKLHNQEKSPLPLTMAMGLALRVAGPLKLTMDFKNQLVDNKKEVVTGLEYSMAPSFSLRAGYASAFTDKLPRNGRSMLEQFRGGLGLALQSMRLDYAFDPYQYLGKTHHFTVSKSFW